jgi:serine/threonine-protein kinase
MLYQMACGKLPFEGDSMAQLMFKIANEPHPHIREFNPQVPECLAAIIDRALAKDNAQRYQTGAEMAADLRACMGLSTGGGAPSPQVDFNL